MSTESLIDKLEAAAWDETGTREGRILKVDDAIAIVQDYFRSEILDDKDEIIKLQRQRIESLENAIGLAKNDYYDKLSDYDCGLWEHPLMTNLMAVLSNDGYGPFSKGTQICLVKAALRSIPEPDLESVQQEYYKRGWKEAQEHYNKPVSVSQIAAKVNPCDEGDMEFYKDHVRTVLDAAGVKYE